VGVSAVVVRDGAVLLGRRRGAHGAGSWAFPGGKVSAGEDPQVTAARELAEETGLQAVRISQIGWTSDVFPADDLHYVTLHHLVEATGEPEVREPDKAHEWLWWRDLDRLPTPMFGPAAALWATGWRPPKT
jgi:8-oxo-dGTP diphosphatase